MAFDDNGILTAKEIEEIENDGDKITGRVHDGFDSFNGGDKADLRARRQASGSWTEEDISPTPDPIGTYSGPTRGADVKNLDELHAFAEYRENQARERWPDYDQIIDRFITPRLHEVDPDKFRQAFLSDDFVEQCYKFGKQEERELRSKVPSRAEIDAMQSGDELMARLQELSHSAMSREEEEEDGPFVTRSEIKAMNQLPAEDFAKWLDVLKARNR